MKKRLVFWLLLIVTLFPFFRTVWQKRAPYWSTFDPGEARRAYEISQYVVEKNPSWIPDELHFSYASWDYINGGSPILVNPDYPPLGKYIVGLSQKYLHNEKIPTLFFGLMSLFSFFLIANQLFKNKVLALLPVALFSWERLFQEQLIYLPLFELFALTFLNFSFYFFLKAEDKDGYFWTSSLFLGALWATKPWMLTIPLMTSWLVYLIFKKNVRKIIGWLISLPIAFLVIVLSYFRLLIEGWSIYKILSVQKWIMWYHRSKLVNFGTVWPFIYLKRWYVWWGEKPYLPVDQWNIFWPIFTTLALVFSLLVLLKTLGLKSKQLSRFKFDQKAIVFCLWVLFDLAFLSVGNTNVRYVFYLLPFVYLLGVYFIFNLKNFNG